MFKLSTLLSSSFLVSVVYAAGSETYYDVPAFDYEILDTDTSTSESVLKVLQQEGIIALKNIPGYEEKREEYLKAAAKCALIAGENGADFLLSKTLNDGTKRYTISTNSGKQLIDAAQETKDLCPGYLEKYQDFSGLIETAITKLGKALDRTSFSISSVDNFDSTKLMTESVHLDHFHAYEAVSSAANKDDQQLSLEMHVDNGMMIAMTAPKYFDVVSSSSVQDKNMDLKDTGLLVQTSDGNIVRPLLQEDELVIMVGEGFQQWIHTSPTLRPVPHGMKYPRISLEGGERLIRAWFGKMVLLTPEQRMHNTGMTFGEYADRTTRYLTMEAEDDSTFASLACPSGRRLHDNDKKCAMKECVAKEGKDPEVSCNVQCNINPMSRPGADKLCEENCVCTEKTGNATYCWMLCVFDRPEGECEFGQRCLTGLEAPMLVDQKRVCASNSTNQTNASNVSNVGDSDSPAPTPSPPASESSSHVILSTLALFISTIMIHLCM
jgi:hypothetical protein